MPPLTGLAAATGYVDGPAQEIGLSMPDPTAGITAAWAVVNALYQADVSGNGEHLDVSLWEATGTLNMEGWMQYTLGGGEPKPMGNRSPYAAPQGTFACAGDDEWVAIACVTDAHWLALASLLATDLNSEQAMDQRYHNNAARLAKQEELESLIQRWTETRSAWDITDQLQQLGVPAFPTMTTHELLQDPHLNARQFIERLEHPVVGCKAHTGIPWRLHQRPNGVRRPAPCIGADTDDVVQRLLRDGKNRLTSLKDSGVVSQH